MKSIIKPLGVSMVLGCATVALGQGTGPKIDRVDVKFVGPASVSEEYIRGNIRLHAGSNYAPNLTEDDVHLLYGTGQFYNIRVQVDPADDGGVVLTYVVQVRPRITEIRFEGNKKLKDSKLKKKVTFKVGEPLDEQKVFTDVQEIKNLYEKAAFPTPRSNTSSISRNSPATASSFSTSRKVRSSRSRTWNFSAPPASSKSNCARSSRCGGAGFSPGSPAPAISSRTISTATATG